MSHPIRPESYISMDNFYTSTVYSKGAEIVGIYKTLLGTVAAAPPHIPCHLIPLHPGITQFDLLTPCVAR